MGVVWMRAAHLVRRGWRSTVLLAVLAGLAAAVAMAMLAAGRRTATAYDRFAAYADAPELLINFCPPDVEIIEEGDLDLCYTYDAVEERALLVDLPQVAAAARGSFRGLTVAPTERPDETVAASALALLDPGIAPGLGGRYQVVEGRDADARDEVVVNEVLAARSGLGIGDLAELTFWSPSELGSFPSGSATFTGPSVTATVVGIGRSLTDLAAAQQGFGSDEAAIAMVPLAMAKATRGAGGFTGVLVEATDDDAAALSAAIEAAFPHRLFNVAPSIGPDEIEPTRDAIQYEAHATTALGGMVALLAVAFVAQAVARQSRREWTEGPILRALGFSTRDAGITAATRGLAIGLPSAVLAAALAVALSPRGPVGVGRRAEVDPGVHVDVPVIALGALSVAAVCTLGAVAPLVRGRALRAAAPRPPRPRSRHSFRLSPVANAGLHLARTGRGAAVEVAAALVSASVAVIAVVAAVCLTASFDDLARNPERFGAPWDVSVSASLAGTVDVEALLRQPDLAESIVQVAVITGIDLRIDGELAWVHTYKPLPEVADEALPFPILDGRPPGTAREIAVGALTLEDLGRSIGDTVTVSGSSTGRDFEMTVVGTVVINDNFEPSPGRGAVVTPEFVAEAAPEITGDPVILALDPTVDVTAWVDDVRARYEGAVDVPLQQAAVRNVGRIRELPYVMAAVVALLAAASLTHALVLSVGRNRRVLGMLKGLGFTRAQVGTTVAWHATSYAVTALVVALPLGVVAGRWGWRLVAESLGVPAVAIVPLLALGLPVIGLLLLANVAAVYPAWRAARLSTAAALRAE